MAEMRHLACAKASDATTAEATHVAAAEATHVTSTEAAHVTSTEAAHVASAKAATVPSAATAAAGLRPRGDKAAGKQGARQNHHHSSSHYTLHWMGGCSATGPCQTWACFSKTEADVAMDWRWEFSSVVSIKFSFNQPMNARLARARQARSLIDRMLLQAG